MLSRSIKNALPSSARHLCICSIDQALHRCCQEGDIEQALHLLSSKESCSPSYLSFLSLLKTCNSSKNLVHVRHIHKHLALHGLHLSDALGNPLIVTLAKCGALEEAQGLLRCITNRTVYSWTAIISAYTEHGRASNALQTYTHMLSDGIQPDLYTFVSLFKACGITFNVVEGMRMHADAHKKGLTANVFAGSALLSMYGKCQYLAEAERVFLGLSERDIVSWSAMLSAYVDMGLAKKALRLYRQMQEDCRASNRLLFVLVLQACGCLEEDEDADFLSGQSITSAAFDIGQAVHAEAHRRGFISDVFVGSALVHMYGKCGLMAQAEHVFLGLCVHDLANWNSMLSAYVEQGQAIDALLLYRQLHVKGMKANKLTIIIALQACAIYAEEEEAELSEEEEGKPTQVVSFHLAQAFQEDVASKGLTADVLVGSALINLYGKCRNMLEEVEYIFCLLAHRSVVSWTAIMSAYLKQGEGNKVLQLYRQVREEGLTLDQHTYVLGVQACSMVLEKEEITFTTGLNLVVDIGQALHSEIRALGYAANIFICTALINMYSKSSSIVEAENVFTSLSVHNVVSWTALLSAYSEQGEAIKVLQLYYQMLKGGIVPDGPVFVLTFQACTVIWEKESAQEEHTVRFVSLEIGRELHRDCKMLGLASNSMVAGSLLSMYGKCGAIVHAEDVFDALHQRNACICGSMISAFIENGRSERAIQLYKHLSKDNALMDDALFSCILRACSDAGNLEVCRDVHFSITATGLNSCLNLANTLVHSYGSCASMVDGQSVVMESLQPDMVSWSACISGFAQGGNLTCLEVLSSMQAEGNEPGAMTFLSVLTFCSHVGLTDEGFHYLLSMSKDYGIALEPKHYLVLTDLLGRGGDFRRIEKFIWVSPMINNVSIWLILLAACSRHGNVELGEHAFNCIINLQPKEAVAYVLMANTFTETTIEVEEELFATWKSDTKLCHMLYEDEPLCTQRDSQFFGIH